MRKSAAVTLLILFCAAQAFVFAQSRPRRAGQSSTPAQTTNEDAPSTTTSAPSTAPTPFPTSQRSGQTTRTQSGSGGEVSEEVGDDEVVRVNASLVTVPVSVLDRDGRFMAGLHKDDFRIFEDGVEQQVAYFAPVEQPFTVALLIDTSGSTRFKMEEMQDAAIAFLDQLRPADRVIVISFDDQIRVLSEATNDRAQLRDAIRRTRNGDGTRLYDAVDLVIRQQLSRIDGRKAVVLFTDGVDTTSKHSSYRSTLAEAEELDAMIYPIEYDTYDDAGGGGGGNWPGRGRNPRNGGGGIGGILGSIIIGGSGGPMGGGRGGGGRGRGGGAGGSRDDYERAGQYLHGLADETGGRLFDADTMGNVEEAFTSIADELRQQYQLGYYPSRQAQAQEQRQIKVRVKRPNLVVRARDSYIYKPAGGSAPPTNTAQDDTQHPPELRGRHFSTEAARAGTKE
ncbi:MAG TPA: VWA domain-containing protein [Pyrinomonadaceae bacterium]|nr:VWA domain-containing protein [Pyrinomonadaceae bacterium]